MEQKQFDDLVKKLELYSRQYPTAYKLRVALLVALGYAFPLGLLGLSFGMIVAILYFFTFTAAAIGFIGLPIALSTVVIRTVRYRFPEIEGEHIDHTFAPKLFEMIGEIRDGMNAPRVDHVLLTGELNLSIIQRPKLGILGWHENYLTIGLSALHALSLDEFRAAMAHEFGHLSGNHGHLDVVIARVRDTWKRIHENIESKRPRGASLTEKFSGWYAPYLNAYSSVLARSREYEADLQSVVLCGKESTARSLVMIALKSQYEKTKFIPELLNGSGEERELPHDAYSRLLSALEGPLDEQDSRTWFGECLHKVPRWHDSHPPLAERLSAIGYPDINTNSGLGEFGVGGPRSTAASYLLTNHPAKLIAKKNAGWRNSVEEEWRERDDFEREAEATLTALERKAEIEELSIKEMWARARLTADLRGPVAAVPLLEEVLENEPENSRALFTMSHAMLIQGNNLGIDSFERLFAKDVGYIPAGCEIIQSFLFRRGQFTQASAYQKRSDEYLQTVANAQQERKEISFKKTFSHHGLQLDEVTSLIEEFSKIPLLRRAYLVQMDVKLFPEKPAYVLALLPNYPWHGDYGRVTEKSLVSEFTKNNISPVNTSVIVVGKRHKMLRRKIEGVRGAEIYRK